LPDEARTGPPLDATLTAPFPDDACTSAVEPLTITSPLPDITRIFTPRGSRTSKSTLASPPWLHLREE
jgi:hypothetical protein